MEFKEVPLTPKTAETLIALSEDWEAENSCYGYRRNEINDLEGRRIFIAEDSGLIAGYLFGLIETSEKQASFMPKGTAYFEVEELYIRPEYRSQGIGQNLFRYAEKQIAGETAYIMLSTAAKNWKAILHFYLDELEMSFWSARLFKKISPPGRADKQV